MLGGKHSTMLMTMGMTLMLLVLPLHCRAFINTRNPFHMMQHIIPYHIEDHHQNNHEVNSRKEAFKSSSLVGGAALRAGATDVDASACACKKKLLREMLAEAIGTGIIVHLGCGTVCAAIYRSAQVGLFQIAAIWAIAVSLAIYCTAGISGAHLNPAMTLAFSVLRDFPKGKVIWYWLAQVIGATSAAALNYALYAKQILLFEASEGIIRGTFDSFRSAAAFGEYFIETNIGWKTAFLAEACGTCVLAFVIFALTNKNNKDTVPKGMEPALIGCTVAALISVLAPLTHAGFNPARDFGPRIISHFMGWGHTVAYKVSS